MNEWACFVLLNIRCSLLEKYWLRNDLWNGISDTKKLRTFRWALIFTMCWVTWILCHNKSKKKLEVRERALLIMTDEAPKNWNHLCRRPFTQINDRVNYCILYIFSNYPCSIFQMELTQSGILGCNQKLKVELRSFSKLGSKNYKSVFLIDYFGVNYEVNST